MLRLLSRPRDCSSIRGGVVCMARLCSSASLGPNYPSKRVWQAGYKLNFSDPHASRIKRRKDRGARRVMCGKHYKRDFDMHGWLRSTAARSSLQCAHTPHAEHAVRSGRRGRGRTATGRGGRSNAGGRRAPPAMAAIQGDSPVTVSSHCCGFEWSEHRLSTRRQPVGANMVSVAEPTRSARAKSSESKKGGTPTRSQSRKN